jgi:hypothetical protein
VFLHLTQWHTASFTSDAKEHWNALRRKVAEWQSETMSNDTCRITERYNSEYRPAGQREIYNSRNSYRIYRAGMNNNQTNNTVWPTETSLLKPHSYSPIILRCSIPLLKSSDRLNVGAEWLDESEVRIEPVNLLL